MFLNDSVKTILDTATPRLAQAGCDTPRLDAEVLLAHSLQKDRTWLYAHPQQLVTQEQAAQFAALLQRRQQREPVAYLTGQREFFGLNFHVNSHVLIPRPETELLVETALRLAQSAQSATPHAPRTIADIGTGSGCIAITLGKHISPATLFAVDISTEALRVARKNAQLHQVIEKINFLQGSLLAPLAQPVSMIVSNPPYVSRPELRSAMPEVSQYEPALALDGGEDGLDLIRDLLVQAQEKLIPGGYLLAEIGASQGRVVTQLARRHFPHGQVGLKQDLAGRDRLLVIQAKNV